MVDSSGVKARFSVTTSPGPGGPRGPRRCLFNIHFKENKKLKVVLTLWDFKPLNMSVASQRMKTFSLLIQTKTNTCENRHISRHFSSLLSEGEEGRERSIRWLAAVRAWTGGPRLHPRSAPRPGIVHVWTGAQTPNLLVTGQRSNQPRCTSQGARSFKRCKYIGRQTMFWGAKTHYFLKRQLSPNRFADSMHSQLKCQQAFWRNRGTNPKIQMEMQRAYKSQMILKMENKAGRFALSDVRTLRSSMVMKTSGVTGGGRASRAPHRPETRPLCVWGGDSSVGGKEVLLHKLCRKSWMAAWKIRI